MDPSLLVGAWTKMKSYLFNVLPFWWPVYTSLMHHPAVSTTDSFRLLWPEWPPGPDKKDASRVQWVPPTAGNKLVHSGKKWPQSHTQSWRIRLASPTKYYQRFWIRTNIWASVRPLRTQRSGILAWSNWRIDGHTVNDHRVHGFGYGCKMQRGTFRLLQDSFIKSSLYLGPWQPCSLCLSTTSYRCHTHCMYM